MKKISTNLFSIVIVLVLLVLLFLTTDLFAQRQPYSSSELIRNATIQMDKDGTSPAFIKFQEGLQPTMFSFLNEYKKSFPAFGGEDNELRLSQTFKDNLGETHYRFDQYYKGVKVEEAQFILHEKNGYVRSANGKLIHGIEADIKPRLSENSALNNAIRYIGAEKYMWENKTNEDFLKREQNNLDATFYPKGQLTLTCGTDDLLSKNLKLVYRFDIYAEKPLSRYYVDVSALSGEIVNKIERIHHSDVAGSGASLYNGNVSMAVDEVTAGSLYRLQEHTTRSAAIETYNMQNGTDYNLAVDFNATSENGTWDQTGVNVHWGTEATFDYYLTNHGRNSFDNAGGTIFSYAHAAVNYNNAFWDGSRMTYGDGDGVNFTPFVCIDVVGHEITHGVTEHSANLIYWGESGALNESFSDIFGNEIEFSKEGVPGVGTGSWRCGEDMTPSGLGIRNMQNPNDFNDPDTYLGTYWVTTGSGDNGGVHTNSGVQNFWFYLLCEGGNGTNDNGHTYNVTAIGLTKAAAIAYRNLTVYLIPGSNYYAARIASINSATDLYGAGSSEVQAVKDAWDAVGVYEPVSPSGILVWEGVLSGSDYSGVYINTFLNGAGLTTNYTNVFPPSLIGYDAVFLSFGNFSNQSTFFEDWMASIVRNYLESGGKLYLEGGDALGYDQVNNTTLLNLFGLSSASDGATNVIDGLAGQSGAITNGMSFTSSNQVSNTYIDLYTPSTGLVSFIESDYGNVAVQNTGSYGQKTFCFSYALSQLVDGISPSTKNELLAQITNFLSSAVPSFVTLTSPNGNDIWKVGTQHKIKWSKYLVDNVKLEYSTDNGTSWIEIIASTPASAGEYEWTIPNTPSTQCKVKVSDVLSTSIYDVSDNAFTIRPLGPVAEQEPNNTAPEAMLTGMFDEIEGTISPDNDVDYFKFTAMAGDIVEINGEERNSSDLYGLIMLFDQNGNQLYTNDFFSGTPTKQRIVYQLPNSGVYYVRYSNQNNWGGYPNIAAKGNDGDNETESMLKPNQSLQKVNAPLAYSGDYRLTIGYFSASAPMVMYNYYERLKYNSVNFYGALYPNGLPTTVTFEYGLTTGYGSTIQPNPALYNGLNAVGTIPIKVSGLQPNMTYHFRMIVENSAGINYGEDVTFTTLAEPEGWVHQESGLSNDNTHFRGVHFIDENTGYIVGNVYILKTTDAGTNWINQTISDGYGLQDIDFATSNIGIAVGGNGTIARTTDGGATWSSQQGTITNNYLFGIGFGDVNTGYAVGSNGTILKTTDAGENWNVLANSPTTATLREVQCIDANHGAIVGFGGVIITTTDGGANWNMMTIPSSNDLYGVSFTDLNNGWVVGSGSETLVTTNGGTTWNSQNLGNLYYLNAVYFADASNGIAVGDGGIILRTTNGGNNWIPENSGTTASLRDICTNVKSTIVGDYLTILRSQDYLTLNSPNGGEIWKVGQNYDIKWNSSGVDNIDIAYSTDNGSTWPYSIATNQPANTGKYTWPVPNTISTQCKVKITKTGNGVSDESNAVFEIKAAGVTAEVEPNNTANEAMNVGIIDEIEGTISPENDIDYFKFTGSAGDLVQIYGEAINSSDLYGLIMLFDQNGNQLATGSNFMSTPTKQRVVYQLPSNGIYYVRYSNWNNWGNYPNVAVKGNGQNDVLDRMAKVNEETQIPNAPMALNGDYRLTIGYFTPSAPLLGYTYTTDLNYNSARIRGQIYPNGSPTTITINWGLTTGYGNSLVVATDANGLGEYYFTSEKLNGLQASTQYHYQVVLQNSFGITTGDDRVFSTPSAPVNWVHQNSGITDQLSGVDFADVNNGFTVSGGHNIILKTTNGGDTWTNVCPTNLSPWFAGYGLDVINTTKIVAVGSFGLILRSEDGGNSWISQQVGNYWHRGVSFFDVDNGVVVNDNGEIFKTTDGGNNWSQLTDPITTAFLDVKMLNTNTIVALSSDSWVIRSTDGGSTWNSQQILPWSNWQGGISFADANTGLIGLGNFLYLFKTTDGGISWTEINSISPGNYPAVSMIDANNAIVGGSSVQRTTNGGATWTQENTGTWNWIYGIKAISYGEVWAVGEWGTILHVPTHYFNPVWTGNPYTPMNIYVTSAQLDGVDLGADDEIAVFDGDNCVGFVKLTQAIPSGGYVQIIASTDDPTTLEVDGFIVGHTITYKLWDNNNAREITEVIPTYSLGDGTFSSLGSASVSLNGVFTITQDVELTTGWNIFSLTATPDDPNMLQLLNPLISGGMLIKTQNEQGNSVEQLPVIGWINNIGDWLATEGYYIKVSASSILSVTGPPVSLPINIPLTTGWNIMGYPLQAEQNALTVLDPLIAANQLIKVQDETGNSVEQLPIIGWINNIGNFKMDEGYSIKVNTNTSLTLDEPVPPVNILAKIKEKGKQKTNTLNKPTANHFTPIWSNNPVFPMNIFVYSASLQGGGNLGAGDEIGVFDGSNCVGVVVLTGPISTYVQIIASADDQTTPAIDGFISGHTISYKFWLAATSTEVSEYTVSYLVGNGTFAPQGTAAVNFTGILPVELTSFTANVNNNKVNLNWETATEVNNYGFEIERSLTQSLSKGEGFSQWKKIGFVQGNGNSNSPKSYSFVDKNLVGGSKFQYRLKQIDVDGKYNYSDVVEVEVIPTEYALYQNYPNPFNPSTTIRYSLPHAGKVLLKVFDVIGNEISTLVNEEKEVGNFEVEFNGKNLATGIYLFKLQAGEYTAVKKMMLIK